MIETLIEKGKTDARVEKRESPFPPQENSSHLWKRLTMNNAELFNTLEHAHDIPVIVEGKRDAAALEALGFSHIFILNSARGSLRERVERIVDALSSHEKEVCLLFDNDAEGRKLIARIAPILHELGIRTDHALKKEIRKAGVSHVEGLYAFVRNKEDFDKPLKSSIEPL